MFDLSIDGPDMARIASEVGGLSQPLKLFMQSEDV